jgi:hypothetical protein
MQLVLFGDRNGVEVGTNQAFGRRRFFDFRNNAPPMHVQATCEPTRLGSEKRPILQDIDRHSTPLSFNDGSDVLSDGCQNLRHAWIGSAPVCNR